MDCHHMPVAREAKRRSFGKKTSPYFFGFQVTGLGFGMRVRVTGGAPRGKPPWSSWPRTPCPYLRFIDSCITQLKAQGPSRTSKDGEEEVTGGAPRERPPWLRWPRTPCRWRSGSSRPSDMTPPGSKVRVDDFALCLRVQG